MSNPYDESQQQRGAYEQGQQQNPYGQQAQHQPQQYNPYGEQGSPYGGQQQGPYGHDPYATSAPSAQQHDTYTESGQQHPGVEQGTHGRQPDNPYAARQDPVSVAGEGQEAAGEQNKIVESSYGEGQGGYSQHDPYGQQAKSSAPAQAATPWQQGQDGAADADEDGATVLAPGGWMNQDRGTGTTPLPSDEHDDATVLAPAGWNRQQDSAPAVASDEHDDATVLAPGGWSQGRAQTGSASGQGYGSGQGSAADAQGSAAGQSYAGQSQTYGSQSQTYGSQTQSFGSQGEGAGGLTRAERPSDADHSASYAGQGFSGQQSDPYAAQGYGQQSASDPYGQQSASTYGQSQSDPYAGQGFTSQPSASDPYAAQAYGQQPADPYAAQSGQPYAQQGYAEPYGNAQQGFGQQPMMGAPMMGGMPLDEKGMVPQGVLPSQLPPDQERSQASMAHWLPIIIGWLGPLIIMLTSGEKSPWVKQHAKESLNFEITLTIGYVISYLLMLVGIGFITWPLIWVFGLVLHIMAAQAAGKGQTYKYPGAIRIIS